MARKIDLEKLPLERRLVRVVGHFNDGNTVEYEASDPKDFRDGVEHSGLFMARVTATVTEEGIETESQSCTFCDKFHMMGIAKMAFEEIVERDPMHAARLLRALMALLSKKTGGPSGMLGMMLGMGEDVAGDEDAEDTDEEEDETPRHDVFFGDTYEDDLP